MRKAVVALVLVAVLAGPASAESVSPPLLALAQAVARAKAAGFDVRLAQADAAIASADAASSRTSLRPQVSVSANALDANEPQLGMPVARQAYASASVTLPIYSPAAALTARAADASALAMRTSAAAASNDAVFATAQAYRRVQLADAVVAARRAAVAAGESHLVVTQQRVAAGKSARYLLARDRAALATAQQAQEDAASERDQSANDLQALLDMEIAAITVEPLERLFVSDSRDATRERALRNRAAYVAAEQRLVAAQGTVDAARAAYRPSATLTAQTYNGASSPALGSAGGQVQISASLPVVDGGARTAAAAKARAEYERARAMRDQVRAAVLRDVANAWREYEAASRDVTIATSALADAQEQQRIAAVRENAGKAIAAEVLDAISAVASARETLARNIARSDVAVAAIHHAAGDAAP
ncbi:MAG: hypothetical protein QOJ39_2902 [Candidatus Eremiobacteraeota bacterium]|nr:hypothetical protein [Candidatus Eremiobacteraeota bacterium]